MNFLVLLEKHQNAILGTLIVHILIFVWLNIQNVSFYVIQPVIVKSMLLINKYPLDKDKFANILLSNIAGEITE